MLYYQIHVGCFIDLMKLLKSFTKICTTGLFRKLVHFYNRTGNWQKYIVVEFSLVYMEKYMYLLLYYRGILKCINCFTNGIGIPRCLLKTQWKFKSIYRMYFYLFFVIQHQFPFSYVSFLCFLLFLCHMMYSHPAILLLL